MSSPTLSVDIETFSSVDLKRSGLYKYVQSPDFEILLFAYSLDGDPVTVVDLAQGERLSRAVISALEDPSIIKKAYNAGFEWYCLNKFFRSPLEQWRCTMLHGLYCGYTAGLGATAIALGLPDDKRKMGIGMSLIRTFCIPCKPTKTNGMRTRTLPRHEPEKWQLFKEYCRQDVVTEMEIEKRLSAFPVPEAEQHLWELDQQINAYGVAVDRDLVTSAIHCDEVVTAELTEEAVRLSGLDNPKSVKQLMEWLNEELEEEDKDIPNLQKGTVSDLIKDVQSDKVRRMLEIRQELSKASTKKYVAMRDAVCTDGRVRGLLQFYGANRTGRWAGRLVQVQNLARNYLETLGHARECVKARKLDALRVVYGNIPDTLSQLVRTAFVASPGNTLLAVDFSAIEARVIAWLAGEQWRQEVFATHGKIYEASASAMFGVPIEKIVKGNPEYALRQKGKIAELALGYQGGPGALIAMGALDMGLTEDELPEIVHRWRSANKRIVDFWYSLEGAAMTVMETGQPAGIKGLVIAREGDYENGQDFLTIRLPNGRKLYYARPFVERNEKGRIGLHYHGVNQKTRQWEVIPTYGGKLAENCLAGDSKVLTERGWVELAKVTASDSLWDGVEWVKHRGLIHKGVQQTIGINGVRMTPEHFVLTEEGWRRASSCEGHNGGKVTLPDGYRLCGLGREEIPLEGSLRLREGTDNASDRVPERQTEIVRLPEERGDFCCPVNTRNVEASGLRGMAVNAGSLSSTNSSSLGELRGPGDQGLPGVGHEFRGVLEGHGLRLSEGLVTGPDRCRRQLHPGKLPLGINENTRQEQTEQLGHRDPLGQDDSLRSRREVEHRRDHAPLSSQPQMPQGSLVCDAGRYEPVYDLKDAGPRHRFMVLGQTGPFIVHNCTQAIARDCLAECLTQLAAFGYRIVFHVHDEIVIEIPANETQEAHLQNALDIMSRPIAWAPGLILKGDGFLTRYYRKE